MAEDSGHLDPGRKPSHKSSAPRVRLSCEMCRQRKIKCDKLSPCTNCQRFGTICVPVERARLPRGRTGRPAMDRAPDSDSDLRDRVAKIEQLLGDLARTNSNPMADNPPPTGDLHSMGIEEAPTSFQIGNPGVGSSQGNFFAPENMQAGGTESQIAGSNWKDLFDQAQDLRNAVDNEFDSGPPMLSDAPGYAMFLAGVGEQDNVSRSEYSRREVLSPSQMRKQLCQTYLQHIDPIYRIIHRPSLCAFLLDGKPYLDYGPDHPAPAALACAVYYMGACCLSEQQCTEMFRTSKDTLVSIHQKETDAALQRADFITSNDLTVLQAFVLSLIASRTHDLTRRVWTMLGVALRVAQALSLHSPNPPFPVRPFEREMRNRLWQVIGGLDSLLSLDHGFEPQTRTSWLQNNIPSNVNDSDISFDMEGPVVASEGFTDMTFSLVTQRGSYGWRSLNFSEYMEPQPSTLEMRQKWVDDFKQAAPRMLKDCQPDKFPFHWFTKRTAECISAMMQLIVLRPLQPCPNFTPPRVRGDGILNLAVEGLRTLHDLQTDPRAAPWRISDSSSAIWHAIAVAIAELCVCEDPSLMGRYWPFVEDAYQRFIDMPESHRGAVFAAMEKFMAQGRAHRDKLLGSPGSSGSISGSGINMASNQPFPGPTPPPVVSQSQGPGFSRPHIPTTTSFISTTISQPAFQNPLMAMPDQMAMISPWAAANVWSGMEFTNPGLDSGRDSSWLNYEGFIEDLYSGWR